MAKANISAERLRELLHYDKKTGVFTWKVKMSPSAMAGYVAGTKTTDGYICIVIFRKPYGAHRLAFLYMLGRFPKEQCDHLDGIRDNNKWSNLREATAFVNQQNRHTDRGYSYAADCVFKWKAEISVNHKKIYLGTFKTKAAARKAYIIAKRHYHPGTRL